MFKYIWFITFFLCLIGLIANANANGAPPDYTLDVHGKDNCILLDDTVAARPPVPIPTGDYRVEVSGDAFYGYPTADSRHDKVFIRYTGADEKDHLEALLVGESTILHLVDRYGFFAFFADWSFLGDNGGVVTINFYDLSGVPSADAGPDQVVFDEVILDGSKSYDPDGEIVSYQWQLLHREDSAYNRTAEDVNPTVSDLEPGFYDVVLTVTDNEGAIDNDTMLLGAAGPCEEWPQPDLTGEWTKFSLSYRGTRTIIEGELTIRNIGTEDAGNFKVAYYLSDDNVLDGGDSLIKTKTIRSLPAGNSQKLQFIYQSKDPLHGKFIIAEVDSDSQVLESDEGNNIVTSPQIP